MATYLELGTYIHKRLESTLKFPRSKKRRIRKKWFKKIYGFTKIRSSV